MRIRPVRALVAAVAALGMSVAAAAQQGSVTAEWFAGTWSDAPDCSARVHFLRDGRFYTIDGNSGLWRFEGNVLILTRPDGSGGARHVVQRIDQHTLQASGVTSYRCDGRSDPRTP
jgi:hypothetical protein